jgi:hypothetical protein
MDEMEGVHISNFDEEVSSDGDSSESYGLTQLWGDGNCDEETSESETFQLSDNHLKRMREDVESKVANSAKNCFKTNDGMEKSLFGSRSKRTYEDLVAVKVCWLYPVICFGP